MHTIQGIGGAFLYCEDPEALAAWYAEHFGLVFQTWGETRGTELPGADRDPSSRIATTTFALMKAPEPLPGFKAARINFRVQDLDGLLTRLESAGIEVERNPNADYGRFAWCVDPAGHRLELWEPPESSP